MTRARAKPEQLAESLLCSVEGCTLRWTSNFSRKLCSRHLLNPAPATKPLPLPTREPARPHTEVADRDDQVEF